MKKVKKKKFLGDGVELGSVREDLHLFLLFSFSFYFLKRRMLC